MHPETRSVRLLLLRHGWPVLVLMLLALPALRGVSAATFDGRILNSRGGAVSGATVTLTRGAITSVDQINPGTNPDHVVLPDWHRELFGVLANYPSSAGAIFRNGDVWPAAPADGLGATFWASFDLFRASSITFYLGSDDGSTLSVDGNLLINNDGIHGYVEKSGTVSLTAGTHTVAVWYFESTGPAGLKVDWEGIAFYVANGKTQSESLSRQAFGLQLGEGGYLHFAARSWSGNFWAIPADPLSTTTSSSGAYSFSVPSAELPVTITPSRPNSTFTPASSSGSSTFSLLDSPPTISNIPSQTTLEDTPINVGFTVADQQTPAGSLVVAVSSSNSQLIPRENVSISGTSARTATLSPVPNASGSATLTISVTDGDGETTSMSFPVTVRPVNDDPVARPDTSRPADQRIRIRDFGTIAPTNEVTIEFWQLTTAAVNQSTFLLTADDNNNRINAHVPFGDGKIFWDWGNINGTGAGRQSYMPTIALVGEWVHFALVASQSGNYMRMYTNGVLAATKTGMTPFDRKAGDLWLNGVGRLADFRIWNVARTAGEIAENYTAPVPPGSYGLILNYRFEANAGSTIRDWAGSDKDPYQESVQNGTVESGPAYWDSTEANLAAKLGIQVSEDSPKLIYLPGFDVETAAPAYSAVTASTGTVSQVTDGHFLYTPPPSQAFAFGAHTINWTVGDGSVSTSSSLKLQVNAVNDPPVVGPGTSLAFNGGTQHLAVPPGAWFGNTFTVEGWVFVRSHRNWGRLFDFGNGTSSDNVLGTLSQGVSGQPGLHIFRGGSGSYVNSTAILPLNTWIHLAFTRDKDGFGHIFINGVDTAANRIDPPGNVNRVRNYLGRSNWSGDSYADARFAEVRIWNVARTSDELKGSWSTSLANNTPGLLAAYHLNEGSGSIAFDAATADGAQDATLVDGPSWQPIDGPAKSMAFNGTADYAETAYDPALGITGPITLEAWVLPAVGGIGATMGIVEKHAASQGGYALRLTDGVAEFRTLDNTATFSSVKGSTLIPANVWTHVAGRWDGNQMQVYVNGVLDGSVMAGRNPKAGNVLLTIGGFGGADGEAPQHLFSGRIGDARIWNVARTAAEISAWRGGVPANAPGLVVNYLFNEGSGPNLTNAVGSSSLIAALHGNPTWASAEATLPTLQVVTYTEDTPLDLVLPAFDIDTPDLTYSDIRASTGTVTVTQVPGSLPKYAPPSNYHGPATISYSASDGTTTLSSKIYLQGIPVEDGPTLAESGSTGIADRTIDEGSSTSDLTLYVTGGDPESTQDLAVTASSSDTSLVPNPVVTYTSSAGTARLSYKPRPGRSGVAVINVVVTETGSGLTTNKSFNLTVVAVDDPPNVGPATSLQFNGANYVRLPGFGAAMPADEITIEFWQKAKEAVAQSSFQMSLDIPNSRVNAHVPWRDGEVYWDFGDINGAGRLHYRPPVSITGSWQHFAFVASRSGNYMKIFRNGIEEATKPGMTSFSPDNSNLTLGNFNGELAEFRLWKVARTGPEILSSMHASVTHDTPNLVAYYRFNQKPTTTLVDFASAAGQGGSQDGELISDQADTDPSWNTTTTSTPWQTSDLTLRVLQTMRVPDGASTNIFLPAWDAEDGLGPDLKWLDASASTGTVAQVSGGLWTYTAPVGYNGPATISYSVKVSTSTKPVVSASINLLVVVARNDPPTIASLPNVAAEEDSPLIEIPFAVDDDQPPSDLVITPVLLVNGGIIQSATVPGGGRYRSLNVVPKPGEIGTVHIRLLVHDAGGKSAQTEFDLRIEPKPAFSVFDLGVLPGKSASFGTAINDRGAVTGYTADDVELEKNAVGFYFGGIENGGVPEGGIQPVQVGPEPMGSPFRSWAINNNYVLAGAGKVGGGTNVWFKDSEAAVISLGRFTDGAFAEGRALNDDGYIAGVGMRNNKRRAFHVGPNLVLSSDLGVGPAPFDAESEAFGLNSSNHIVGSIWAADGRRRAMVWSDNVMRPLFNVPNDTNSVAYGVNRFDQVVGSTTSFAMGDSALRFDGVDDSVTLPNLLDNAAPGTPLVAGNAAHTIEAWVRVDKVQTPQSWLLLLGAAVGGSALIVVTPEGELLFGYAQGSAGVVKRPVAVGAWTHVAMTYDPQSYMMIVYFNGQNVASRVQNNVFLQGIQLTLAKAVSGEAYFQGALDEVRVWRTTRTAGEIAANYKKRLTGSESGLVAYLPFDEGSGTIHTKSTALGQLVGTLTGNPEWTVRGGLPSPALMVNDPVLQLDGFSSKATFSGINISNRSFTVEFRARRAQLGTPNNVLSQGTPEFSKGLVIGFRAGNTFTFALWGNDLDTTSPYTDLDWHHWACTLNVTGGVRRIYRDGVQVSSDVVTTPYKGLGPMSLGYSQAAADIGVPGWFQGALDDVRVWNVARTAEEIAAYQSVRLPGDTPGLISSFTFDEGSGDVAANRVPGGPTATLDGAIGWAGQDTGSMRAFYYDTLSGRLSSLGTVPAGGASEARAINDFGQIVGTAAKGSVSHAFFRTAGRLNDLNDLLPEADLLDQWVLESASGINRSGAVVGTGTHRGLKRAFLAMPATVIGRPVIRPEGAVDRYPSITILKKHRPDDSNDNSFFWSERERKLYAIRPVVARLEWFTSLTDTVGTGSEFRVKTDRIVSLTVNVWPRNPTLHIAGAPVDMQPAATAASYTFLQLIYKTNLAAVEPSTRVFTSPGPGYTVVHYLRTDGQAPDPGTQRSYFEVVRTVEWSDTSHVQLKQADWTIGSEVTEAGHGEYNGKNGFVLFPRAPYDAVGSDPAYDRGTRLGPILPVNTEKPGGNNDANPDPLVVVWYRINRIGVAWASVPVQYSLHWPADHVVPRIVIASQEGSGELSAALYPARTIYNQPDITQPGFNPNEEHAMLPENVLFALRDDLNALKNYSEPYALLKYRDPKTDRWRMKVYQVVAEQHPYFFKYPGTVGKEIQPPLPLSVLPLCDTSHFQPSNSQVGWEDYNGKLYARQAGPNGTRTNLLIRWFYPMQPGFFHPDAVAIGDCVAWLDRRPADHLAGPNSVVGTPDTPIDVIYDMGWDDHPVLQIGETLVHSKGGLPDVFNMANARVIFDSLSPNDSAGLETLTRFYDPLSPRTLKTAVFIPPTVKRQSIGGKEYFTDLPWMLKVRLSRDPLNNWLSFSGYLDENFGVGEPLLLPNVLSERERDRLIELADGNGKWKDLINRLYDLTRNPNGVDLSPKDGRADSALRVGLTTNVTVVESKRTLGSPLLASTVKTTKTNVVAETFGGGPKVLTTGIGGVPAALPIPGKALSFNGTDGYVTVGPNGDHDLSLANTPFTIEFWAKPTDRTTEEYVVGQPGGAADFGRLRIGFRDSGEFAFDLGTASASVSLFTTSSAYKDAYWHHWACTFDPGTKVQRVYRDGVLVADRTDVTLSYSGSGLVEFGRFGSKFFAGQLDEIRVWKTARTQSEIRFQMNKRLLGVHTPPPTGPGSELGLEILYRCDEASGALVNECLPTMPGYPAIPSAGVTRVTSTAPTGIPPRYITLAENNDPSLGGLPVALHVIRIDDGPFLGDLKVLPGDNVFDQRLTLRHSSDFGGDPGPLTFQWYYKPIGADFDPTDLPKPTDPTADDIPGWELREWIPYTRFAPATGAGVNFITTGEGGESSLITLSDNAFICRYKGYAVNRSTKDTWSGWVGDPSGTPDQPRAALAEGWVKRVIRGLNPFDARTADFHSSPAVTFASMLVQLGQRYEGPIAFNPGADAINGVGLIEAYTTVLQRARGFSIDGNPQVDFNPANNALLLAATKLSDFYMVLGNEAYADASDPTIGFGSGSLEYGSLSSSTFAFQNQLDSLLEEELALLRGRDDSAAGVGAAPAYNRLFWNFTLGEGEVAYQQNYNISDADKNGFLDEKDARLLFPQGHGDAWGHYLSALRQHYDLLRHPRFTWVPRTELVNVAGAAIRVDFLDERKFANAAAAKARAGAEIVDLTYRLNYVDDPAGQWQGYKDTQVDRAWGVTEWARRAGLGAYFDWVVGNAILPSTDPDPNHTGIDKIDRQTVRELSEIPSQHEEIQTRLDQADAGLNPLGLAKGVVPFDIDPSLISSGMTHYEQIQDRAVKALNNAATVWDEVNKTTQALRRNQDSVEELTAQVIDQERDYKNRLIEIYGYPYAGDIGPGQTYPAGYDGPDLYHYMYVPVPDLEGTLYPDGPGFKAFFQRMNLGIDINGDPETRGFRLTTSTVPDNIDSGFSGLIQPRVRLTRPVRTFFFPEDFDSDLSNPVYGLEATNRILGVNYPTTLARYRFSPPAAWGRRSAPGELQLALADQIQAEARLRAAIKAEDALLSDIADRVELLNAHYDLRAEELQIRENFAAIQAGLATVVAVARVVQATTASSAKSVLRLADATAESFPYTTGLAANDMSGALRFTVREAGWSIATAQELVSGISGGVADVAFAGIAVAQGQQYSEIDKAKFKYEIRQQVDELERLMHREGATRLEGVSLAEALRQMQGRYQAALSKGARLIEERVAYRARISARTTENRYRDMTFRSFRSDALQKYRASFDLAQRYVFLAATAYDYESNLIGTDTRGGRAFLTDIIRQRAIGQMLNGRPVVGRSGLADPLARMSGNFDVLRTQLGFNNPQTETGRFSLRKELFRLRDDSDSDWRARLQAHREPNLWNVPEFRRCCRSFAPESEGPQPGIVVRFPTRITAGRNFFGFPLGGGDSAYDSSRFATKIRSAGVWFSSYNGLGLSQTPRVYLVPAGAEVLSSPTPNDFTFREWLVVDQALPVPFAIGANRLSSKSWIPINDTLGGSFAEIRRFASFRAYHDSGGFNPAEAVTDSRLIGRSVWNKEWILIIPGQTFLADANAGLDAFIASVDDIKLFFQTYSYSGN